MPKTKQKATQNTILQITKNSQDKNIWQNIFLVIHYNQFEGLE